MDFINSLMELGVQPNSATVYVALLELGLTKTGPLIKTTKLHRMLVYNALDDLINKDLVSVVHKNNIKMFHATDPDVLIERTKKLNELAQNIVPDLRRIQQQKQDVINVRTLIGREGFKTNLENIIDSAAKQKNREMCIIGGAKDVDFYETAGDWYPTYTKLLDKKNIKKRLLAPASYSTVFKKNFVAEKNTELRTLTKGLTSPTYTRITEEMVSIEMYQPQIVIIQIRNKLIAQAYLDSFQLLWNNS